MGAAAVGLVGTGVGMLGTGLNIMGQNAAADSQLSAIDAQTKSKQAYYGYVANTLNQNATLATETAARNAHNTETSAGYEFADMQSKDKQLAGAQVAAMAANGVSGSATAEDVARDTIRKQNLDEMALKYNTDSKADEITRQGSIDAYNFRTQARGQQLAALDAANAGEIQKAGVRLNKTSSILGGATSLLSQGLGGYSQFMEMA